MYLSPIINSLFICLFWFFYVCGKVPVLLWAVPNLQWQGLAKSLVVFSQAPAVYSIWLIPCAGFITALLKYRIKEEKHRVRWGLILRIIWTLTSIAFVLWYQFGVLSMQDQSTASMGI